MPYTLSLATEATRDLVVEALRQAGNQRTRVALAASRKVAEAKLAKRDVRSQAVKVTDLLAQADTLVELAAELEAAESMPVLTMHPAAAAVVEELKAVDLTRLEDPTPLDDAAMAVGTDAEEDDGTSPEAQALAAMAGLTAIVEDGVDTGAIAEDEPADNDVEDVLA